MKIMICGSMAFAKDMVKVKNQRWVHEVSIMQPKFLEGDLSRIK